MNAHLIVLVILCIAFGAYITSSVYERPWHWTSYVCVVLILLGISYNTYRVLNAQPRIINITILHFPPDRGGYVS